MVDPVMGAALGAAGKAGKAVAKTADDPKLRHALLLPAATVIGKHWARNAEEWFEKGRNKRMENLGRHVDEAIRIGGRERLEAVESDPAFHEWAEGVSKVDPGDAELSILWQAALEEIQSKGRDRLRILSIVKQLGPDEAYEFARYGSSLRNGYVSIFSSPLERFYRRKFSSLGLLVTRAGGYLDNLSPISILTLLTFIITAGTVTAFTYMSIYRYYDPKVTSLNVPQILGVGFALSGFAAVITLSMTSRLTRLGRDLHDSYLAVRKAHSQGTVSTDEPL